ncbi:MAG: lipoprotein [Nitrospirales bacterium]|nr:MAG: lipoprotein [Nitrospirales bacterium]
MSKWLAIFLCIAAAFGQTIGGQASGPATRTFCSDSWYRFIDENVPTSDGQGHGPDIGSDEWKSVIEFKLGIRGKPHLPSRDSEAWCRHIDKMVLDNRISSKSVKYPGGTAKARGPSFACNKVVAGSIEALICEDEELSALDRKLSDVYASASIKATNEHPAVLKAEQRGWIKGRDDCWKSEDTRGCVRDGYTRRIAELQARYRLVPHSGPVSFMCEDNFANEVVATFFQTRPPTLIAERGDSVSLMFLQPSGSGAKYQGRNETFWEHQGQALITWGHGASAMHCKKAS